MLKTCPVWPVARAFGLCAFMLGTCASSFAHAAAPVFDVDGDGAPDIVHRQVRFDDQQPLVGRLVILSGKSGEPLRSYVASEPNDLFGYSVCVLEDLSGDGVAELAVTAPQAAYVPPGEPGMGRVYVLSGADGTLISSVEDPMSYGLGARVAAIPDQDGDGLSELLIAGGRLEAGGTRGSTPRNTWWIASSVTGDVLEVIQDPAGRAAELQERFGMALAPLWSESAAPGWRSAPFGLAGDLNADGVVDFSDLTRLLSLWAEAGSEGANGRAILGDINEDYRINALDMTRLLSQFGLDERMLDGTASRWGGPDEEPCRRSPRRCRFVNSPGGGGPVIGDGPESGDGPWDVPHQGDIPAEDDPGSGGCETDPCTPPDFVPYIPPCPDCDCIGNQCECVPCSQSCDADGDGIPNPSDCNSSCYQGNPQNCACSVSVASCSPPPSPPDGPVPHLLMVLPESGPGSVALSATGTPSGGTFQWFTGLGSFPNPALASPVLTVEAPGAFRVRVQYTVLVAGRECKASKECAYVTWRPDLKEPPPSQPCPGQTVTLVVDPASLPWGSVNWAISQGEELVDGVLIDGGTIRFDVIDIGEIHVQANFLLEGEIKTSRTWIMESDGAACVDNVEQGPANCQAQHAGGTKTPAISDPVNLFSGEFLHEQEDLFIPGRGMDFRFARTYRSKTGMADQIAGFGSGPIGNNWDHSYNLFVSRPAPGSSSLIYHDGTGRTDKFDFDGESLVRKEYFAPLRYEMGHVTYTTGDGTKSYFFDPDNQADPARGRVERIVDRNGNEMLFDYDSLGRLAEITDTLGRSIQFGYAGNDPKIVSITDFAGRVVGYSYHGAQSGTGNDGDLAAATLPGFTATAAFPLEPQHVAFSSGRTWTYTYYKGSGPHSTNLETIADPRGLELTRNFYSADSSPTDPTYDRVVRQTRGGLEYLYKYEAPGVDPSIPSLWRRTWVVNRAGHVMHFAYDGLNRLRRKVHLTGFYDPNAAWKNGIPPRTPKLRPEDPEAFTWTYDYNIDSQITREVLPNGDEVHSEFDSGNSILEKRGNLIRRVRIPAGITLSCTGGECIEESWEYAFSFGGGGGCCGGWGFPTAHVDPMGRRTTFIYDQSNGDLLEIKSPRVPASSTLDGIFQEPIEQREYNPNGQLTRREYPVVAAGSRVDTYVYYDGTEGPAFAAMRGYLKSVTVAFGSLNMTTAFEYDAAGGTIAVIDPAGARSEQLRNQAGLPVRELSPPTQAGGSIRNRRDLFYDASLNLIEVDIENRDEGGALDPSNPTLTSSFQYDSLSQLTHAAREIDAATTTIEERTYDGNDRVILLKQGEAFAGDSGNTISRSYDERGMLYIETRAPASATPSATRFDYDLNGNLARSGGVEFGGRTRHALRL